MTVDEAPSLLADTPDPPYVAVIFASVRSGEDSEGYAAMGERMATLAMEQPGYLGMEYAEDPTGGCGITVSYWKDAASVELWRSHAEHLVAQESGRSRWYDSFRLRVARVERQTVLNDAHVVRSETKADFAALVSSRKGWIETSLRPWCVRASRADLLLAEQEWHDIAGRADPVKTLWAWAWNRFPELVHADLGIDETAEVVVMLSNGREVRGYPDARQSQQGRLMLLGNQENGDSGELGPFSIDDVRSVRRVS